MSRYDLNWQCDFRNSTLSNKEKNQILPILFSLQYILGKKFSLYFPSAILMLVILFWPQSWQSCLILYTRLTNDNFWVLINWIYSIHPSSKKDTQIYITKMLRRKGYGEINSIIYNNIPYYYIEIILNILSFTPILDPKYIKEQIFSLKCQN